MQIVTGQDQAVADWAAQQLGKPFVAPFMAIGFSKDGQSIDGAAIFNGWNGSNIDLTIYAPNCGTREAIGFVYRYAFEQIRANRITARTQRANKTMQRLLPRLGFVFEGVTKKYYGADRKDDAIVFRLEPEHAKRWMN